MVIATKTKHKNIAPNVASDLELLADIADNPLNYQVYRKKQVGNEIGQLMSDSSLYAMKYHNLFAILGGVGWEAAPRLLQYVGLAMSITGTIQGNHDAASSGWGLFCAGTIWDGWKSHSRQGDYEKLKLQNKALTLLVDELSERRNAGYQNKG